MTDEFRVEDLRLEGVLAFSVRPRRRTTAKREGAFLKGPIPWAWLCEAARGKGKALHVACALWFLRGMSRSPQVSLARRVLGPLGVDRYAANRALRTLEELKLVTVERKRGCAAVVTLLGFEARTSALDDVFSEATSRNEPERNISHLPDTNRPTSR